MSEVTKAGPTFAELFAQDNNQPKKMRTPGLGESVEGPVVLVTKDAIFINLGAKLQGYFERNEFVEQVPELGAILKGVVTASEDGALKLATRLGRGETNTDTLRAAFEQGVPVEGKVSGIVKGGVTVDIGGIRGFCPASQLEDHFVQDLTQYALRTLTFLITKLESRDVVLSRRALLVRASKDAESQLLSNLAIGSTTKGRVTQIRDFGAFIDLGGITGLVPSRELSHDRVKADDVLKVGDVVEVQVLSVGKKESNDPKKTARTEITLSLRALAKDPWDGIETFATPGKVVAGSVSRLAEFGAFVRLAPGVDGLIHISEFGGKATHADQVTSVGTSLVARVISVDVAKKRIALGLARDGAQVGSSEEGYRLVQGAVVKALIEKVENFGVVVQVAGTKGRNGRATIPNNETGTKPGQDLRKIFEAGTEVVAKVIDASQGRARLSIRQAVEDAERANFDAYRQDAQQQGGMGTFADLLKKKMG